MQRPILKKTSAHFKKGFTLIELMVVIAIIGFLSSIVLASLNVARQKGENAAVIDQVEQIEKAIQLSYKPNNNSYPGTFGLNQFGCLAVTAPGNRCYFSVSNNNPVPAYQAAARAEIEKYIVLKALEPAIVSDTGRRFDSVRYASDGNTFIIEYALKNTDDCVFSGATQFGGLVGDVLICRYTSR